MIKQTRTQKYSDLRNQLENNNEVEGKTEGLSSYEEKLKNVEETLLGQNTNAQPEEVETPVVEEVTEVEVQEEPTVIEEVENPSIEEVHEVAVLEAPQEAIEEPEVVEENPTNGDDYLEKCLEEVNEYNKAQGLLTAEDVPGHILDEVRGTIAEEPVEEETEEEMSQEELNNTVTLEIKQILESMDEEPVVEEPSKEITPEETVVEETQEEKAKPSEADIEKLFETVGIPKEAIDLLAPYLNGVNTESATELTEEEKAIEAEKIEEEIEKTKVGLLIAQGENNSEEKLLNDTIPFMVDTQKEDDEEETEEDEDSTPNKFLNIILIFFIVVLLVVLGVIVFWILQAQGILQ